MRRLSGGHTYTNGLAAHDEPMATQTLFEGTPFEGITFQELIQRLNAYWAAQGCVLVQPLDLEVGAGTFHPATFLRALGPEPWNAAYVQPCNGMEVTQFTYFQQAGGMECRPVLGEITYGLERLCMYLQNVDNVFDIVWTHGPDGAPVTYRDVYHQNEVEQSAYNFEHADVAELFHRFDACETEAFKLIELALPLPAYEQVTKASHSFNLLDARRAISVTERQRYILRVRKLSQAVAEAYHAQREKLGFPGLKESGVKQEAAA